ncbi:MAG: universal stress protein [Sulfitobacter sp.]
MYTNILIPVVFDAEHNTGKSYAIARQLADEGAKFTVVHVMETIPTYATSQIPESLLASRRNEIADLLEQSAKALPDAESALLHGHAGRAIVDFAEQKGVDCIIVASHRPGMGDFFIGSTAANVVRHAKCSVHVIR